MGKYYFFFLLFISTSLFGQYFNPGQDRGILKWKKIETIHFEVIFPVEFENEAKRVVYLMEKSYKFTTQSLNHKPKKISVILHNETVQSNAFLGWAPSRIEMYTTPNQKIYSQDWLEQLAIHEYRHMVQLSKIEEEMPKLLKLLFGEQAAAFLTAAYLPFWFIEGDAVATETGLSKSGRGRLPNFHKELKALVVQNKIYSYDKAYLGSYKDFVANHYKLGYFLVGGARMLYDKIIWDDVVHNVAQKPFSLRAFDKGLKKSIGKTKVQLYDTVFYTIRSNWIDEDKQKELSKFEALNKNSKDYTNYNFAFENSDSTIVAYKSGLSEIGKFIQIDKSGVESQIFTPGYYFSESVTGKDSLVVWIERLPHIRWSYADGSLLRKLNLNTGNVTDYEFKTKLFAPSVSPNNMNVVAVEGNNKYQFFLNIINLSSGEIIKQISTKGDFFITPSWSVDGKSLYVVALRENKKGILKIDIESANTIEILPFDNQEISRPLEYGNDVYFIGDYDGTDNLYKITNGEIIKVFESRFGIAEPSIASNNMLFSYYTANGYKLGKQTVDSLKDNLKIEKKQYKIAESITKQEPPIIDFTSNDDAIDYQSVKYSKLKHLFRVHSWAPIAIDPYSQTAQLGASIMSQNMLGTSSFVGGYRYRWADEQGEWFTNYRYMGWFPNIEIGTSTGNRDSYYYQLQKYVNDKNEIVKTDTIRKDFTWRESNMNVSISIPLNLSKGQYTRKVQPSITYKYSLFQGDDRVFDGFPGGDYQSIEAGLLAYTIKKKSQQDLLANFGVILNISYIKALSGVYNYGSLFATSNTLYLPGVHQNHGITLYNGYQLKSNTTYAFSDRIRLARGHNPVASSSLYSFGVDYRLPLIYPDLNVWGVTYIKRVNLKLFYDQSVFSGFIVVNESSTKYSGTLKSTGVELSSNLHLFRFIAPIEVGFRSSYLFDEGFKTNFLFSINFTI